ncbi:MULTISPECIES: hypothetical protein [Corynebacterium]|jgi:polyferredoxin|uniref:Uncharacterized protein n=1 Tax=Corynebacterium provencense TaxID=1737425 RepID=A0A2Z3YV17_9CORY|nr:MULTISPECIES: hypothetical protein [Corynebacterium]AWT26424.1 hypothetical protein Csp1_16400 [Corynebacterium provencense]MCI1256493.1 hypothetical protein [Corynebacterium provencense]
MLALALVLSLIGFIALLVALYLGSVLWAWVCVGIAAAGIILFVTDLVVSKRR